MNLARPLAATNPKATIFSAISAVLSASALKHFAAFAGELAKRDSARATFRWNAEAQRSAEYAEVLGLKVTSHRNNGSPNPHI